MFIFIIIIYLFLTDIQHIAMDYLRIPHDDYEIITWPYIWLKYIYEQIM